MGKDYDRIFTILSVILTDNEKVTPNLLKGVTKKRRGLRGKELLHIKVSVQNMSCTEASPSL